MAKRERNHKLGGSVCLNAIGRFARDDGLGSAMIRGILKQNQSDPYALKAPQNYLTTLPIWARLEQGLNVDPEPARCALRSYRRPGGPGGYPPGLPQTRTCSH
jgi:hypothetical protein